MRTLIFKLLPRFVFTSVALGSLVALSACDRQVEQTEQAEPDIETAKQEEIIESKSGLTGRLDISKRGSEMLDAAFEDPDGLPVNLREFKGKPLLVNIWATWCAPCIVEMPMLDALAKREHERLNVMVVSQDIQGAARVTPFFEKQDFEMLSAYIDPQNNLGFGFATGLMPTTVLYDAQGKEVWRVTGAMDWDGTRAATLLADTLASGGPS